MDPLPEENCHVGPRNHGALGHHHHHHASGGLSVIQEPALLRSVLPSAPYSGAAGMAPGPPVAAAPEAALVPSIQPLGGDRVDATVCLRLDVPVAGTARGEAGVRWIDPVDSAVALRCPGEGSGRTGSPRTHIQGHWQGQQR